MNIEDGNIYFINFKGNVGREINKIHLGVIYTLPSIKDVVFCIPLTSPKLKHFKTKKDFYKRNYKNVKHFSWQYLKQTDSIALLDQAKTISTDRILNPYLNKTQQNIKLDEKTQNLLKSKILKYMELILYKYDKKQSIKFSKNFTQIKNSIKSNILIEQK